MVKHGKKSPRYVWRCAKHVSPRQAQQFRRYWEQEISGAGPSRRGVLLGAAIGFLLLVSLWLFGCTPSPQVQDTEHRVEQWVVQHQLAIHGACTAVTYAYAQARPASIPVLLEWGNAVRVSVQPQLDVTELGAALVASMPPAELEVRQLVAVLVPAMNQSLRLLEPHPGVLLVSVADIGTCVVQGAMLAQGGA